jgi:hypothetical protein
MEVDSNRQPGEGHEPTTPEREGRKSVPETNSAAIKLFTDITKESYCCLEEI